MTTSPHPPTGDGDWLLPPAETMQAPAGEPRPARFAALRRYGAAGGLLVGGALAGALVVQAATGNSATPSATNLPGTSQGGQLPFGGPQAPGGADGTRGDDPDGDGRGRFGGGGGLAGEQRLTGTLTAVGASTVTVRTSAGTATYAVTRETQIVRDDAPAALSQLRTGDAVLVHVYPSSGGGRLLVEQIFAGALPQLGGGQQQQPTLPRT